MCTLRRVTTSVHQPTCLSVSRSVVGVLLYRWSTLPTWWTCRKKPPASWLFIRHTPSTAGPWMMSSSLPTHLAWQVRRIQQRGLVKCLSRLVVFVSKHVFPFFLIFSDVQMYICNKESYGYFPVPMRSHATLQDEVESFLHTQLEVMGESRGQRVLREA